MTAYLWGFWLTVLTISIAKSEAARYKVSDICPLTALGYVTEGKTCNKPLQKLKESINAFILTGEKQGCNSSCSAYFNYKENDSKLYDISQARVSVFNKIRNVTWLYDVDCKMVPNNSRRMLSINCNEVESNAFFYQRWCRNTSDCLQDQECNHFGDLGVCSRACKNDTLFGNTFHQTDFEVSSPLPFKILNSGFQLGHVIGAVIGGFVLGLAVCAVAVISFLKNQKAIKQKPTKVEVQLANDSGCKTYTKVNINKNVSGLAGNPSKDKRSSVEPIRDTCSIEEYSTFNNTKQDNEDFYSHLNEKMEKRDLDDYDHAHLSTKSNFH